MCLNEPLDDAEAEELIETILDEESVAFSGHARNDKFPAENMDEADCRNVLRGGWVETSEWENGSWRYHVCTHKFTLVIAFRSRESLVVVTCWRNR